MFTVNVSPDMAMYHLLRNQGYDPAYALAEFVDNALQAHEEHCAAKGRKAPLALDIYVYSSDFSKAKHRNSIIVKDKGPGIRKTALADAMKPAKPPAKKGLSEFGIGMKAAAVWFADSWELSTKPTGSGTTYSLEFDLTKLVAAAADSVQVKEERTTDETGTTIALKNLRRPIDQVRFDQICADLTELYQRYTEGSAPKLILTAHFNDTPVDLKYQVGPRPVLVAPQYKQVDKKIYSIGKDKKWSIPIKTTFQGSSIEGFICLLEKGSYVDNPGLVMFRGNRVIQGTVRKPNLPASLFRTGNKYSRQRVYGQLFADGLPVTYTKDAFEVDMEAFATQIRSVPGMDDLLRQAEEYRANKAPSAHVGKDTDIPVGKGRKDNKEKKPPPIAAPAPAPPPGTSKPPPPPPPPPKAPIMALLEDLRPLTNNLAIRSMMEEVMYQHQFRREIATALCLRTVIELLTLDYIRRKHPGVYASVEGLGIKRLLNNMNSNRKVYFGAGDQRVVKCVEGLATGSQADVVLLNNVAHGNYHPTMAELNKFAINMEPLARWAAQ